MPEQPILPKRYSTSPFERPTIALQRLLEMDPGAAGRALVAPETLSPTERTTLADRYGVTSKGGGGDWYDAVLRTIQNPLVLWGAVMSMKYPIQSLKGILTYAPHLTGKLKRLDFLARHLGGKDEIFRGTPLPKLLGDVMQRTMDFKRDYTYKVAHAIAKYEKASGKPLNRRMEVLLSAKLDGLDNPAAGRSRTLLKTISQGAAFDALYKDVRVIKESLWKDVFADAGDAALLNALARKNISKSYYRGLVAAKKAKTISRADRELLTSINRSRSAGMKSISESLLMMGIDPSSISRGVEKIPDYFPHRIARQTKDFAEQMRQLIAGTTESRSGRAAAAAAENVSTPHALLRKGTVGPDPDDLELIKDHLLDPKVIDKYRGAVQNGALTYSLRYRPVMESYISSLGRAKAWTVEGYGGRITDAMRDLETPGPVGSRTGPGTSLALGNTLKAQILRDSYIPMALGRDTYQQTIAAARWAETKLRFSEWIDTPRIKGAISKVPGGSEVYSFVRKNLAEDRGFLAHRNLQGKMASYLYWSTLGMPNVVSAGYNLMQLLLTTVPTIGAKATYTGLQRTLKQVPKYFEQRSRGLTHDQAVGKVFPAFKSQGLVAAPLADEAVLQNLEQTWLTTLSMPGATTRAIDKVREASMLMFRHSENLVRLTTFEGAYAKGIAEGMTKDVALDAARQITELTQFAGGPLTRPNVMANWGPLSRQFGVFPAATLRFMGDTAGVMGSGAKTGALGRNWGTLGRMALTSGLTYEAGKSLGGVDLTQGLIAGAIPTPQEGTPGYPIPWLPPIARLGLGAAADLLGGTTENTRKNLPMLVPGGVGFARWATVLSPETAKVLGRRYIDYNAKTADGTFPMYSTDGQLQGYLSDWDVYAEGFGIPPGGASSAKEGREMRSYLIAQTDRIRGYRRAYLDAVARNSYAEAAEVKRDYSLAYPGLGPLTTTESDLETMHMRTMVPALERTLEGMPKEAQPMFGRMIQMSLMEKAESLMGVDPALLQTSDTPKGRDAWRVQRPSTPMERLYRNKQRNLPMTAMPAR